MHIFSDIIGYIGFFGGISAVILASSKARIDKMRAERQIWQQPAASSDPALLEEMKAMHRQIAEMQSTGHQFDISFDEALNRLESRVSRIETKSAAGAASTAAAAPGQTLRNGQSQ